VDAPSGTAGERQAGNLTVRTKLNEQSQYDILGIDLHVPSSGATASIRLPGPPPAVTSNEGPSGENQQLSHLTALNSRSQFMQASIDPRGSQEVSMSDQARRAEPSPTSLASLLPSSSTSSVIRAKGPVPDSEKSLTKTPNGALSKLTYDQTRVQDPEKPGRMATNNALNKRKSDRVQVPDPQHPGLTISRGKLNHRKLVLDPENPGQMISRNELANGKTNRDQVPDPDYPGQMVTRHTLDKRTSDRIRVSDPHDPHDPISQGTLYKRKYMQKRAVAGNPGQTTIQKTQDKRKLVREPIPI